MTTSQDDKVELVGPRIRTAGRYFVKGAQFHVRLTLAAAVVTPVMSRLDRWIRRAPDRSEFICNEDIRRVATDQPGFLPE